MIPWQEYKLSLERNQVDKQQAPSLTLTQTQNSNPTPNPNPNQADKQQALLRGDALYQYIVDLNCKAQNAADTTAQAGSPQGGTAEHFTETGGGLVISNPVGGAAVSVSKVQAAASIPMGSPWSCQSCQLTFQTRVALRSHVKCCNQLPDALVR